MLNGISIQQLRFCFTTCMVRIWTYLLFSVVCSKLLCSQKPPENKVQPLLSTDGVTEAGGGLMTCPTGAADGLIEIFMKDVCLENRTGC